MIDSGGALDLAVVARLAGVSVDEIRRLNPALTRQTVQRTGSYRLLVPASHAAALRTQLAGLAAQQRLHWVRHSINAGDTLSGIAQRYRIGTARLRQFNGLSDSRIMAGDLLIVPVARG